MAGVEPLVYRERPAAGDPDGLLVLHHGRGTSEGDLLGLADALDAGRPPVSGILAFSGFVPEVEGWQPHFEDRCDTRAFIAHGRSDRTIGVDFAHRARGQLEAGGLEVEYHESDIGHQIDPAHLRAASEWLDATLPS